MTKQTITIDGETHTLPEWCRIKGANYSRTRWRVRHGVPLLQAMQPGYMYERKLTIGKHTRTQKMWHQKIGIAKQTFSSRRKRGWSDEDLLKPKPDYLYEAFGRKQTLTAWSAEYQKKKKTVWWRIKHGGLSLELALTLPVGPTARKKVTP